MPMIAKLVYIRGSLRKGAGFSFIVVTAPSTCAVAVSTRNIVVASNSVQTAPVAGSSNLAAFGLCRTWRSGRSVADGTLYTRVIARTWLKGTSGEGGEHGGRPYSRDVRQRGLVFTLLSY